MCLSDECNDHLTGKMNGEGQSQNDEQVLVCYYRRDGVANFNPDYESGEEPIQLV